MLTNPHGPGGALSVEVIDDLQALERLAPAWDELAAQSQRPAALAGWQLAWWRHLAPRDAVLRVVVAREGDELVAVAPFAARPGAFGSWDYRLLAVDVTQRVEPVAAAGRLPEAAAAIARGLTGASPAPGTLELDSADAGGAWLSALTGGWPGRRPPWHLTDQLRPAPVADLRHESYEAWLATRRASFRKQARRFRKRLLEAGGTVRMTRTPDELERDVDAFLRLHHQRWDARGGSDIAREIAPMLCDAGRALLRTERFRLWIVELDGRPVAAQLLLAAGRTVQAWNSGFDAAASQARPLLVAILAAVEDAIERGEQTLDLGGGAHEYKLRIADDDRPLASTVLVPRGRRYPLDRAGVAPRQARELARRGVAALPERQQDRVRDALRRVRS